MTNCNCALTIGRDHTGPHHHPLCTLYISTHNARTRAAWPPPNHQTIDTERITDAINGYTITNASPTPHGAIVLQLQGLELPDIRLTINGGTWTATVDTA